MTAAGTPAGAGQVRNPFKSFLSPGADQIDITFYGTEITLQPGQSLPSQINIDAGTDFYWFASSYQTSIAGVAFDPTSNQPLVPLINLIITDTGSQRNLMNQAVPVTTVAGDGKLPYRLLLPRLFKANSIVQFNWSSFEDSNIDTLDFVMHGFRLPPNADFSQYFR